MMTEMVLKELLEPHDALRDALTAKPLEMPLFLVVCMVERCFSFVIKKSAKSVKVRVS
jgi:hypothetical protein